MGSLFARKLSERARGVLPAALFVLLLAGAASAQQIRLAHDAHTSSAAPAATAAVSPTLNVSSVPGGATQTAYIKFNPAQSLPPTTTVNDVAKATLRLYVSGAPVGGMVQVHRVVGAWNEGALSYNTRPALGAVEASNVWVGAAGAYVEVDLTQLFKDWVKGAAAGGADNQGVAVVPASPTMNVSFDSKENTGTSHEPTLTVTLVDSKLKADLAAEKTARETADANLQALVSAEASARQTADAALQTALNAANAAVTAEAAARQTAVSGEAAARQSAVGAEASARQAADAALQTAVDAAKAAVTAEVDARAAAVAAEAQARQSGDAALQNSLNTEAAARQAAITQLQDLLNSAQAAIAAESSARQAAVSSLQTSLNSLKAALDTEKAVRQAVDEQLQSGLTRETADRAAGDALLRNDLTNEVAARQTAVGNEAAARQTAVAAEAQARQSGDAALQNSLNTEAAARQAGDTGLQNNLNAEAARASNAEATLSNNVSALQTGQTTLTTNLQTAQTAINALQTYVGGGEAQITNVTNALKALMDEVVSLRNDSAPVGTIMAFAGPSAKIPAGWELCDGRLVTLNAETQALYNAIGVSWGSTTGGASNFRLPDLRGRFLRGLDSSPTQGQTGRDPDRNSRSAPNAGGNSGNQVGSVQDDMFVSHGHSVNDPGHGHRLPRGILTDAHGGYGVGGGWGGADTQDVGRDYVIGSTTNISINSNGGNETRAKNAAVLYIIRVK